MVAIDNRVKRSNSSKKAGSNQEKLRLRAWLQQEANRGTIPGLKWVDEEKTELRIPWLHGSKQTWSINDVLLFQRWAEYTGRYSSDCICPKRWKANFRCALKSLSDVVELPCCGQTRGKEAFRVYKFLEPSHLSKKQGAAVKNSIALAGHVCKNRRRTTSGTTSTSCSSPLAHDSEASGTVSEEEDELMDEDYFHDDTSIEDVFEDACNLNNDRQSSLMRVEDDVRLLLREIEQSDVAFGELFLGKSVDHAYYTADTSEFSTQILDDSASKLNMDFFPFDQLNFELVDEKRQSSVYNLPDMDHLMMGLA